MSTFETKEEYLQFISAWKIATNAEEAKSKRLVCDHVQFNWSYHGYTDEERTALEAKGYIVNKSGNRYTIPDGGHYKEHGWLDSSHYIFHSMMRGKDPKRGFHPKSKRKLQYPNSPWTAFVNGALRLEYVIKDAEAYIDHLGKGKGHKSLAGNVSKKFLEPFSGLLELSDLLRIDMEELANARKFHR